MGVQNPRPDSPDQVLGIARHSGRGSWAIIASCSKVGPSMRSAALAASSKCVSYEILAGICAAKIEDFASISRGQTGKIEKYFV